MNRSLAPSQFLSAERFFEAAVDLLCMADLDGRFLRVSPSWTRVLGWSSDELCGRPYIEFVHPEDRAETLAASSSLAHGDTVTRFTNRYRRKDGTWAWLEWTSIVASDDGVLYATARDVTFDRRAADRADAVEAVSGVGSWELDLLTNDLRWSNQVFAIYELDPSHQLDVSSALDQFPPDDRAKLSAALTRSAADGRAFDLVLSFVSMAGAPKIVRATGAAQISDSGVTKLYGAFQDLTLQKRAERSLSNILQGSDVGTWEWNEQTGETRFNERWASMAGYTLEQLSPVSVETWRILLHPDDLAEAERRLGEHFSGARPHYECELRMRRPDGDYIWVHAHGQVISFMPDGSPEWVAGVHIDIDARKRAEAAMARAARLGRMIEESLTEIFVFDAADLRFLEVNRGARENLGYGIDALLAMTPLDIKPDIDRDGFEAILAPLRNGAAEIVALKTLHQRADGSTYVADIRVQLMKAEREVFVAMARDVTEEQRREQELHAAREAAEASDRAKSAFLATMSHEIRTPLNGILGTIALLDASTLTSEQNRMMRVVRESGDVLLSVINDILDLSKVDAGKIELERAPFRPADLLTSIQMIYSLKASEKDVTLIVDPCLDADHRRLGDQTRVQQILHNVVSNAVKFTLEGSVTISMSCCPLEPLRIRVSDTGIGMTPDQLERMFDRFSQADSSTTRRFGGTGLGMSIVRGLVDAMDGSIRVQSTPDLGTSVEIELPLPVVHAQPLSASEAGPIVDLAPLSLHVLVADDNAINRTVLEAMLDNLGVRSVVVDDGEEAVNAYSPDRYDLLMLDISMPRLDGIGALAAIRAREAETGSRLTPALAITAHALREQVDSFINAGFTGHVAKPLHIEGLRAAIVSALPPSRLDRHSTKSPVVKVSAC